MNLGDMIHAKDILVDAGAGFVAGVAYGYSGWGPGGKNTREDSINILEATLDKETLNQNGLNAEVVGKIRDANRVLRRLIPVLAGYPYAFAEHFIRGSYWPGNLFPFIGGALVGESIGRGIRRAGKGLNKKGLAALRDIINHPENAGNYLKNNEKHEVNRGLEEIENAGANGQDISESSVKIIYLALTSRKKIYTEALVRWSLKEVERASNLGVMQAEIKAFFEKVPSPSIAFLGPVDGSKFNVYELNDRNLRSAVVDFNGVSTLKRDGTPRTYIANNLSLTYGSSNNWTGDYRGFSRRLMDENRSRGFILIKSTTDFPEQLKRNTLAMAYLGYMGASSKGD